MGKIEYRIPVVNPLMKSHDIQPFAALGHPGRRVDHACMDKVSQAFQSPPDDFPSSPFVVGFEILHILKEYHRRTFRLDDCRQAKKEITLVGVVEAMFATEALLFRNAGN